MEGKTVHPRVDEHLISRKRENYTACGLRIFSFLDSIHYYDASELDDGEYRFDYYTVIVVPEGLNTGKVAILSYAATNCMVCIKEQTFHHEQEMRVLWGRYVNIDKYPAYQTLPDRFNNYRDEDGMQRYMALAFDVKPYQYKTPLEAAKNSRVMYARSINQITKIWDKEKYGGRTADIISAERAVKIYGFPLIADSIEHAAGVIKGTKYVRLEDRAKFISRKPEITGCV